MNKSSVTEMLRTFSKQELIKFEDFLRSPYFNRRENVLKLFLVIKKFAPDFNNENLEKEKIWKNSFPGTEYNYGIMKNLIHELTKLCESFITIEYSAKDKLKSNIDFLAALLIERGLTRIFLSKAEILEKAYGNPDLKNEGYEMINYYTFLEKLYYLKSFYNWHNNMKSQAAYELTCRLTDNFLYTAIISFYKYYNNYISNNHKKDWDKDNSLEIFLEGLNKNIMPPLLKDAKAKSERDYLVLNCYNCMSKAIKPDADVRSYFNYKKTVQDCSGIVPKDDLRNIMICLANSLRTIREVSALSGINFNKEIFENYNLMIENNIFLEPSGRMDGNLFMIYILSAFALKEFESIESVEKRFSCKIADDRRENDINYSQALICFGK